MPLVSVVIPAYNAASFLGDALAGVRAQTVRDLEAIVVDDGSTDATPAVVAGHPDVRYIRQENQGVACARNRGIAEARGRWVAFLDADDVWRPNKLESQLARLSEVSAGACYTALSRVDIALGGGVVQRSPRRGAILSDLLELGNVVGTPSSVICERTLFERVGGFDVSLSQCADWEMWIRLATVSDFAYVDEPLVLYRHHGDNMSGDVALLERDSVRTLETAFALPALPEALRGRRRRALARNWMVLAGSYYRAGRWDSFARCTVHALRLDWRQAGRLLDYPRRLVARRASS